MAELTNVSLSSVEYGRFLKGVKLKYGSQSMCRNCKSLRESVSEVTFNYGGTE